MLVNITKKVVIVFIIGVLIGAIIATTGFLIFAKTSRSTSNGMMPPSFSQSENSGLPGENGGNSQNNFGNNNQPPQMPGAGNSANGENSQAFQQPEMSNGNNQGSVPQLPGNSNSSN
ncbi:MAG: hypothetical protein J5659_03850 [Clostridia bacterium]|nr:hypothetical protein [Clostridia bacterium]